MNTIHPPFTHLPDLTVGPLVTPQIWLSTAPSHASHLPRADWSPAEVAHHTQSTHFFWGENWDPYGYIYIYGSIEFFRLRMGSSTEIYPRNMVKHVVCRVMISGHLWHFGSRRTLSIFPAAVEALGGPYPWPLLHQLVEVT